MNLLLSPIQTENARYDGSVRWADSNTSVDYRPSYQFKSVCRSQAQNVIEWIQEYLDAGKVDDIGYSAPTAVYQLLEDLRKELKTEVEKPAAHEGPEGPTQS